MNSNWFDFEEELASEFFDKTNVEYIKKNFGLNSKKISRTENWTAATDVNEILDLASAKCDIRNRSKLLDSFLKDKMTGRTLREGGRGPRLSDESMRMRHAYADDFFTDADARVSKVKSRYSATTAADSRYETESQRSGGSSSSTLGKEKKVEGTFEGKPGGYPERSASGASANSYAFSEVTNDLSGRSRKDSVGSTWSRKSSQPHVNFPSSSASTLSDPCGGYSAKTFERSVSRDSDDSTCTEKSINSSTISEKLPDGTDKTQVESNESWLRKSTSGSKIAEKKLNDITLTEKSNDGVCEKSTTRMSYLEKSATGSSLKEEITSEKVTSSGKGGTKTVEQKTSSETFKKSHKVLPNKSSYYQVDDLDTCSFERFGPTFTFSNEERTKTSSAASASSSSSTTSTRRKELLMPNRSMMASEKISKLIDEAVHQDDLFKIPSTLQTDIDRVTDDFFNSRSFTRDRARTGRRRLTDLFLGADKEESYVTCSKMSELRSENDSLQQENIKLQSIIQDVTAVNKRWQKYNNERRLYVQKLLSTIQDLQEQINLISEKSAFQSVSKEENGPQPVEIIERLKKEHQEHVTLLELQIKSHKDDWETERREKRKALQEKEELERRLLDLTREVTFLKEVLQKERQQQDSAVCVACQSNYDANELYQRLDYCPTQTPLSVSNCSNATFCTAVHIPYGAGNLGPEQRYYSEREILEDVNQDRGSYFSVPTRTDLSEPFSGERFPRGTKTKKSLSGETVVVEDESGLRLAITEQFPSKDANLKSILKKSEKKSKGTGKSHKDEPKSPRVLTKPNITCEECSPTDTANFTLSIGFENEGRTQVTSFSPDSVTPCSNYLSVESPQLLKVGCGISRSRSEPNTRSNSSENLKPLRESSSWNSESFAVENGAKDSVVCPSCRRVFSSSMHLKFLDHYELCQTENNRF